ncbi:MAG: serine/threonine-protein kinase [Myxococcota bacterium]
MPVCPFCEVTNQHLGGRCGSIDCVNDDHYFIYDDALTQASSDPRIGTKIAEKYVVVGRISKGGMGAVYRAIQQPVGREVAFKVLRTEMEDSSQVRERFVREAQAISRLGHANIITLFDFGFAKNGQPYMVMEYAPGMSMAKWMMQPDMTTERIVHVTCQLLSALEDAHRQGIVHRDLKPENVIVTETASDKDYVKLLDFGIARVVNETTTKGLTREGEVFGTPHYMSPEQAQGVKDIGPEADIYAVGIILYEMLCGEAPFDAPTPLAVLLQHINEPMPGIIPRPEILVSPELADIVRRATAKERSARFASAAEMLAALMGTLEGAAAMGGYSTNTMRPVTYSSQPVIALPEGLADTLYGEESTSPTPRNLSAPATNIQSGLLRPPSVSIHDSDPSLDVDLSYEGSERGKKLGIIAALLGTLALVFIGGAVLFTRDTSDAELTRDAEASEVAGAATDPVAKRVDAQSEEVVSSAEGANGASAVDVAAGIINDAAIVPDDPGEALVDSTTDAATVEDADTGQAEEVAERDESPRTRARKRRRGRRSSKKAPAKIDPKADAEPEPEPEPEPEVEPEPKAEPKTQPTKFGEPPKNPTKW